jgi:hypothetical protein
MELLFIDFLFNFHHIMYYLAAILLLDLISISVFLLQNVINWFSSIIQKYCPIPKDRRVGKK